MASQGPFWRGRPARRSRPRRRPGALKRLGAFLVGVALLSLVTLGVVQILSSLTHSPRFRLRALAFSHASQALRSRLETRLQGLLGASLFSVDPAKAARALERDPWVRRAVVKRWLPGTLHVSVEERRAAALGQFRGRRVIVDTEGWPIEEPPREWPDMPFLSGISAREPAAFAREASAGLQALSRVRREAPALLEGLESIDLSVPGAVVLKRGPGRPQLWLAREDAGRNLARYRSLEPDLQERFGAAAAVDLRWRDQIALRVGSPGGKTE
jgi:cell division protein FtsQ